VGLNRQWHEQHKMRTNPTEQQRVQWHLEHLQNCDCRRPTPAIQRLIDTYKQKAGTRLINHHDDALGGKW
jgi:hypothetical protein